MLYFLWKDVGNIKNFVFMGADGIGELIHQHELNAVRNIEGMYDTYVNNVEDLVKKTIAETTKINELNNQTVVRPNAYTEEEPSGPIPLSQNHDNKMKQKHYNYYMSDDLELVKPPNELINKSHNNNDHNDDNNNTKPSNNEIIVTNRSIHENNELNKTNDNQIILKPIEEYNLNELRNLAKENGLLANGKKIDIYARIEALNKK